MRILDSKFDGLVLLMEPRVFHDARGYFLEAWSRRDMEAEGVDAEFVQDNESSSIRGCLRGLHFQWPRPQGKLLWVMRGSVFDVVVDVRPGSPTFGAWEGFEISSENHHRLWVSPGFAHGFYVRSASAQLIYKCTEFYAPECEHTLIWNDPEVGIRWPLEPGEVPVMSDKDLAGRPLSAFREAGR